MNSSSSRPSRSINELLVIEIFSGSCNLSTAFVKRGFQALAIDHAQSHKFRTLIFDLTLQADQLLLWEIIRTQRPFLVWLAPPCGTASRARNIPVKNKHGKPFAEPLRSDLFPDGIPSLENIDLDRVLAANTLYEFCENICSLCDSLHIKWIVENPFDSFFWYTSWISQRHRDFTKILFHNCMYGGLRPKRTGLLANFDISSLAIICDNMHDHAPWRSSLKMRYISTPVKRLLTLSYFVLQLPICLQTLLQLKVSLCRHLICLTHRPQIRYILNTSFEAQLASNLVAYNFLSFHLHSMIYGLLKISFPLLAHLYRSSLRLSSRALPSLLSSNLMMGLAPELSSTPLWMTRGR